MNLKKLCVATTLSVAASASFADAVLTTIDLSAGNARFGRDNTIGSFMDTYTFTLADSAYLLSSTASSAASGAQDLDFISLAITDALSRVIASYAGNLGDDQNEFYSLGATFLEAGDYRLVVRGVNSPTQASYSGNLAITPVATAIPEPGTLGLLFAGLGGAFFVNRRKAAAKR